MRTCCKLPPPQSHGFGAQFGEEDGFGARFGEEDGFGGREKEEGTRFAEFRAYSFVEEGTRFAEEEGT